MLKYNIKLTDDSIKQEKLVWSEKYLAPDLSFVSGVTSQDYHLEKFNGLPLANSIVDNTNSSAMLDTENVTRQGYVVIVGKPYEVNSGSVVDYSNESSGDTINYNYLFLNGKYYYSYDINKEQITNDYLERIGVDTVDELTEKEKKELDKLLDNSFKVKDWLVVDAIGDVVEEDISVECPEKDAEQIVKLDTVAWIEDGIVNIDGHDYFFERDIQIDENQKGGLKYYEDGVCLESSAITVCDSIEYHPFESPSDYINVTKLVLTKKEEVNEPFDRISFCKRFFYVRYKDYYLPIREEIKSNGEDEEKFVYSFKCDVPSYALGVKKTEGDNEYYKTIPYDVYGLDEETRIVGDVISGEISTSRETFDMLFNSASCVVIEDGIFDVTYDLMNANEGRMIAIYLDGETTNVAIGDRIKLVDTSETSHTQTVYSIDKFEFNEDDTNFVVFGGKKYKVEDNLCDKVMINGSEYSIDYINGKIESADCLVEIGEEKVPMYISGITSGEYSGGTLMRYGRIISGTSSAATVATYDIKPYSGVTINNKRYIINEQPISDTEVRYYARLDRSNEYIFTIEEIMGSSMLICRPDINTTDFTDEFIDFISRAICQDVVDKQTDMILYTKNKIFGDKEITQELAFQRYSNPVSSDDYFDLFNSLDVFTKSGYIHIPLALTNLQGGDTIQDDVVEHQFFEDVKKRAINPIVDMEKDVYVPKYIYNNNGKYNGSNTEFKPIKQIRVNLHFRTRNLDNWKVNEGYNDRLSSGITNGDSVIGVTDNWFVTDFHPYIDMLESDSNTLMQTSDLVGLLNFTNDDVYYQKSKIAKSFLRFSFYDSIDQQKQSLLATSCVFMDEHRLFKRYIDNSRKNISDFGFAAEPEINIQTKTDEAKGKVKNKIAVSTEYLGDRKDNGMKYVDYDNPYHEGFNGVIIDENHRIGSEFIIDNKYETDTSSEGFYIYIFREYSENLTPKPIYMKVEFNHAGIGKTIPFIIPMEWTDMVIDNEVSRNGKKVPNRPYTLNSNDLNEMKKGIKLEDVYAQTYIPLYAVYDFKNKEYAYVFDSRYVAQDGDDVINLNLFELKIAEDTDTSEDLKKTSSIKNQPTAVIDVNKAQFNVDDKMCSE